MDETIVMRDGYLIAHASTQELYHNPQTHYIASLFGEVNEVPKSWFYKEARDGERL